MKEFILKKLSIPTEYIIAIIIAIIFFVMLYGVRVLDVTYTDFLTGDYEIVEGTFGGMDSTQHYFGWRAYRESNWQFPIGCYNTLSYPENNCIIFTDSLPILAIPFKVLSPILPETFQYFGLWGLFCFIMQGIMSMRILKNYTNNKMQLVLMSTLFTLAPIVVWRMFIHTALDSQWLILLALEPIFASDKFDEDFKKIFRHYLIVSVLASLIHIYLLYFCGIILLCYLIKLLINKSKIYYILIILFSYVVTAGVIIGLLGGFSVSSSGSSVGLDSCSANINSFINGYGNSLFFSELPHYTSDQFFKSMQFEGYSYLGFGIVVGAGVSFVMIIINRRNINIKKIVPIIILFIISLLIALSPTVTLGERVIFKVPLPEPIYKLWSVFRATGRASWICVYLLMLVVCISICKYFDNKITSIILSAIVIIQVGDNSILYVKAHDYFYSDIIPVYTEEYALRDKSFWNELAANDNINHIVLGLTSDPYETESWSSVNNAFYIGISPQNLQFIQFIMGDFAISNDMTLNYFLFARNKYSDGRAYVFDRIENQDKQDEYVYIFWEENKFQAFATGYNVYYADGLYIAYSGELNNDYLISSKDSIYYYDFTSVNANGYDLSPNTAATYAMVELAKGDYTITLDADNCKGIKPIADSAYYGTHYEVELLSIDDNKAIYSIHVDSSDSTACLSILNESDCISSIKSISLNYVTN